MRFDVSFFLSLFPKLVVKIPYTLFLGFLSFFLAFAIGLIIELMYTSKNQILRTCASLYISFFRSTPYIMQLFIFYYGMPQMFDFMKGMSAPAAMIISVAMNCSAFIAETIRGGLQSVDKGQREAALSIGLSKFDMYKEIILPQAFVYAFPSLGNSFISMIKNMAIGFTIGVVELMAQAKLLAGATLRFMEAYVAVGIVYWAFLVIVSQLLRILEKRVSRYM